MALALAPGAALAEARVDLALVLALDSSASVDAGEFALQRDGLAMAFRDGEVAAAIAGGARRRIAVAVIEWAGAAQQEVAVGWTLVGDAASASSLADRIAAIDRAIPTGATSIAGALGFAATLLAAAPFPADRLAIDLSGDGRNNQGRDIEEIRRRVVAQGVTINALAILNEHPTLDRYFEGRVIGGAGAFVEIAEDYGAYVGAIRRKLIREIRPLNLSEPATSSPERQVLMATAPPTAR